MIFRYRLWDIFCRRYYVRFINYATTMPKRIYKYIGPENLDRVFQFPDLVTLKCSLPEEFNDPYELFLTIDFNEKADVLAYYAEAVGELPQLPTTCFSLSPVIIPMWAHYAQNNMGFVIELSEEKLIKAFPESSFDDIDYLDAPKEDLVHFLYRAYGTRKPRHTYFLQSAVLRAAYYSKSSCWSYEQERRMIVRDPETRNIGPLTLIDVPNECITSIICGSRASEQTKQTLLEKAKGIDCQYLELRIGRSSATPYFVDADGQSQSFSGSEIVPNLQHCKECKEPLAQAIKHCSWCQINDALRENAASRNPYRLLAHHGMLQSYIADMDAIGEKYRKDKPWNFSGWLATKLQFANCDTIRDSTSAAPFTSLTSALCELKFD